MSGTSTKWGERMVWGVGVGSPEKRTGYLRFYLPGTKKEQYGHRIAMSLHLGRPLLPTENVHHINGDRKDNRIENLELWTSPQPQGVRASDQSHCFTCTCGDP